MSKSADAMRKPEEAPRNIGADGESLVEAHQSRTDDDKESDLGAQLLESGEFAIVALDPDGRVTDWSRGATRLFGYSESEAKGLESSFLLANDDTQNGVAESVLLATLRDGRSEIEGWCLGKSGRRFWGSGVLSLYGPPERHRFLLVLRDRTDHKLSETEIVEEGRSRDEALDLLNALLVHAPVGFAFLDRSLRPIRVNEQFERMLGAPAAPAGAPIEIAPAHASQIAELVRVVFTTGSQVENVEIEDLVHEREGGRVHYLVSCYPVQDARSGWIVWVGVTAIDISRQKRTEQALASALHTQKVIAREASHRVKNSLQLVASMLTMQARSASSEDVKAAVADARARIMTVARVHDRLWRGIDIGIVELREYLSDLFGDLAQSAPGVRLLHEVEELSLAADQAIPLALMTSELLTNAFKYACPGGEGDVRVTVTRCGERMLRVIVEDSGPGLPEGFDPLGESGSLGMRMIQGFVRQLNGSLRHASANPGARFEIDVPLQDQN